MRPRFDHIAVVFVFQETQLLVCKWGQPRSGLRRLPVSAWTEVLLVDMYHVPEALPRSLL